jgi:hypothetical protein
LDWSRPVTLAHRSACSVLALSFLAARLLNCSFDHHEKQRPANHKCQDFAIALFKVACVFAADGDLATWEFDPIP